MTPGRAYFGGRNPLRLAGWGALTVVVLLVPLIAMQFTDEVDWTLFDFIFAGVVIMGTGLLYEIAAGALDSTVYRIATGVALAAAFLVIWLSGAVGIIGSEDHPANLLYAAVLAAGLGGAIVARFEPEGMARALFATAFVHGLVTLLALFAGPKTLILNGFFIGMWLVSATLFRKVARDRAAPPDESVDI